MKKILYILAFIILGSFFNACVKDLDTIPIDPDSETSEIIFKNPNAYTQFLAKCYSGLALGGNDGDGQGDISGIDGGFSPYLRQYWYHQELSTDEAVIGWEDQTIKDFHYQQWGSSDVFIAAMYARIVYQATLVNEFLRQSEEGRLNDRGISDEWKTKIAQYRLEARFLRALSYWHGLDLFGGTILVTEDDPIGEAGYFPPRVTAQEMFNFIESELLDIAPQMMASRTNEYGRVDQVAAWTLLAKLYLNAEVYIGQPKYTECLTYENMIVGSSYALAPTWRQLFWANNDQDESTMQEIIFPIRFDGIHERTNGGTTFIINASIGGKMDKTDYGVPGDNGGWGGTRVTPQFVEKFDTVNDKRATFFTDGQNLTINDINIFADGYAYPKFVNHSIVNGDTINGSDGNMCDTDFPMFRLADVYLMYAEAVLRGGAGGSTGQAITYINDLRTRAGVSTVSEAEMTLDLILDERARELGWECHRRTDLIRYGMFSQSGYVWQWKGNVKQGQSTDSKYDIFPIPDSEIRSNPNVKQNPGY
ncbi:MAG: RagB/SusD family nutrient uptake outer membrane protein [Bacteroidetes bacterium CG_4_9_14_3_um_filter_41_19]|nr:MAG: RagB/SusD family nutrient uptake outer membrane protein [Bacteroidetes bacterium CG_4_9_14_3_um_filter_41_19]